jgi:RIO-like serine/threonine protein kinase
MGSKNHELVPTKLIGQISGLKNGVHRSISNLAKVNLIAKVQNAKCRVHHFFHLNFSSYISHSYFSKTMATVSHTEAWTT